MQQKELQMEDKLIHQLIHGESQWKLREDLKTENQLWDNFFRILSNNNRDVLDDVPLSENEKSIIKSKVTHSTFYNAAKDFTGANGQYRITLQRDDIKVGTISLLVIDHNNIAGGSSVYEVVHQIQLDKRNDSDRKRRYDVTLLINGLPVIQIELKAPNHSPLEAFNQIQKYITEQKFNGIYSNVQMFVITNGTDTRYIAANQHLQEKLLSGWVDKNNNPVTNYLDFARDVLSIPMAHQLVSAYSVLDSQQKSIILLRPYQIHAIEAIFLASKRQQSGYVWHTTGSGKTLTSYRVAHNLLSIPSLDKVIFLIDRKDLDNQTTQAFQSYANTDSINVKQTEDTAKLAKRLTNTDRNVIVTTRQKLQTLLSWNDNSKNAKIFKKLKNLKLAFIVDECHRTVTPETKIIIDKFFNIKPLWYGFTGTPIFSENKRAENGNAAQTTEQQYGPCLHSYTIKDAIRDHAVLGFKIKGMKNAFSDDVDEDNNKDKLDAEYRSKSHMAGVIKQIFTLAYRQLGLYNFNDRGYTYSSILTVKPNGMRPIEQAKAYYNMIKQIKNGTSDTGITIPKRVQEVLPDFPKVAITFSVTEDDDSSISDQQFMKEAISDYNQTYSTNYTLEEIGTYNKNINERLARKRDQYKPQRERLDLVIVVDRLLTGFDSKYLSTLYVDRPPMQPQDIIQAFSRTNRVFDQDKTYGNIVTFQYPDTFSTKIDNALKLYSQGGIGDVIAPTWEQSKAKFESTLKDIKQYETGDVSILSAPKEEKKKFIQAFQKFDKNLSAIQTYSEFDNVNLEKDYGVTSEKLDAFRGTYKTLLEELKKEPPSDNDESEFDPDYELTTDFNKSVNYQYIVNLIQEYLPQSKEERNLEKEQEIDKYIADLSKTNKPKAEILYDLWQKIKENPANYVNKQIDQILDQMTDRAYEQALVDFANEYCLDFEKVKFAVRNYDVNAERHTGLRDMLNRSSFEKFKSEHTDSKLNRMIDWKKKVRSDLQDMYVNVINPLTKE